MLLKTILLTCVLFVVILLSAAYPLQEQSEVRTSFKTAAQARPNSSGYILDADEGDPIGKNLIKVDPARGSMRLGMATQSFGAGRGIALHMHEHEDEILFILEGTGWGVVGKKQKQLKPGTTIYVPQGVWHGVQNTAQEMKLLWVVSPPNFPQSLRDISTSEKSGLRLTDDERNRIALKHGQKDARYFLAEVLARSIWDGGRDWGRAEFDQEGLTAHYNKDGQAGKLVIQDSLPDGLGFKGEWLRPDGSESPFVMHYDFETDATLTIKWGNGLKAQSTWRRIR